MKKIYDNGIGIDDKLIQQIYEPLVTTKVQGTGLGLTIAKDICMRHGAEISIISEKKHYTQVVLKFKKEIKLT